MGDIGPERRIIQVRPITKPVLPGTPDTLTYGAVTGRAAAARSTRPELRRVRRLLGIPPGLPWRRIPRMWITWRVHRDDAVGTVPPR